MIDLRSASLFRALLTHPISLTVGLFVTSVATGLVGSVWSGGAHLPAFVWMPSGLALGAFLVFGYRAWPVVALAAVIVTGITRGAGGAVLIVAAARTLEPLLAAYLVNRYANGRHALQNPRGCVRLAGLVLIAAALAGIVVTAATSRVSYPTGAGTTALILVAHWLGSAAPMLVLAPAIVLFSRGVPRWTFEQVVEAILALGTLAALGLFGMFGWPFAVPGFPFELLLMPVLLWPALRLGRRATAVAVFVLAGLALIGTVDGLGPFVRATPLASLVIVLVFVSASATIALAFSALSSEYRAADAELRELVVTDALTGLPNYRRLLEVLDEEIARAGRLSREFAVIFCDMDDLKRINDAMGHLAGSRAVFRLAETLRAVLRDRDTAARYGGDEFVAVLPDTDLEGAALVLARLREQLKNDVSQPALSVSAGIAMYPRDGRTPTTLLSTADRALYANKAQRARARGRTVVELQEWTSAS